VNAITGISKEIKLAVSEVVPQ